MGRMRKWDNPSRLGPNRCLINTAADTNSINRTQVNHQIHRSNHQMKPLVSTYTRHLFRGVYRLVTPSLFPKPQLVSFFFQILLSSSTSSSTSSSRRRDQLQPRFHHRTLVEPAWRAGNPQPNDTSHTHQTESTKAPTKHPYILPCKTKIVLNLSKPIYNKIRMYVYCETKE
jgi:hypothetical protein